MTSTAGEQRTALLEQITNLGGTELAVDKLMTTSSGVLIGSPGREVLLGKATGTRRWDLPKGLVEPGEQWSQAAARELAEETGLVVPIAELGLIGEFGYLPGKNLVLFVWRTAPIIDPAGLRCRSSFTSRNGRVLPELDRFGFFARDPALERVGKNMARILSALDWDAVFARG